jgi:hypothetical protein
MMGSVRLDPVVVLHSSRDITLRLGWKEVLRTPRGHVLTKNGVESVPVLVLVVRTSAFFLYAPLLLPVGGYS